MGLFSWSTSHTTASPGCRQKKARSVGRARTKESYLRRILGGKS
ncbi:hypothetical protein C4K39_6297 [Pseudomonas sessilinigenes]|nr:hypothetical protein C4K39_6297 [Pseudomonas sessilinigenes]